jgi:hypothetical protein
VGFKTSTCVGWIPCMSFMDRLCVCRCACVCVCSCGADRHRAEGRGADPTSPSNVPRRDLSHHHDAPVAHTPEQIDQWVFESEGVQLPTQSDTTRKVRVGGRSTGSFDM